MLFNGRKSQLNDVTYIILIFIIMIAVASILPFLQRDLAPDTQTVIITKNDINLINTNSTSVKPNDFEDSLDALGGSPADPAGSSVIGDVVSSIAKMLFWYYGTLPLALELFFIFLKMIFWILIYRLIRSGGG